jgi:hypothetical protein
MRDLTSLLQKADLTPKERCILLVHNDINITKTGKEILTEADKSAIRNWRPKNDSEKDQWKRYREGWKHLVNMNLDTVFIFTEAYMEHLEKQPIIFNLFSYSLYRKINECIRNIKRMKKVSMKEAVEIANKQKAVKLKNGMDLDSAVYRLALESLSNEDKNKLVEIYNEIEYDRQYLDQEEIIADLLAGMSELTDEAKIKLARLMANRAYNHHIKRFQPWSYFASIPLTEVVRHFLIGKGIKDTSLEKSQEADDDDTRDCVQEAVEAYRKINDMTVEAVLKEACLEWLDGDLLEQYKPLVMSDDKELFDRWLKAKIEARKTLEKLIDAGDLKVREYTGYEMKQDTFINRLKEQEFQNKVLEKQYIGGKIITGESLYILTSDCRFVADFKKMADEYEPNAGFVYADDDPDCKGKNLDQELLVCGLSDETEPNIASVFNMPINSLITLLKCGVFFDEIEKDGETFLEFSDDRLEKTFKAGIEVLIKKYSKLLALEKLLKKLSEIYEIDLTYKIKDLLESLEGCMDLHNEALSAATGQTLCGENDNKESEKMDGWPIEHKIVLKTKDGLYIDRSNIVPDEDVLNENTAKLKEIFGDEF